MCPIPGLPAGPGRFGPLWRPTPAVIVPFGTTAKMQRSRRKPATLFFSSLGMQRIARSRKPSCDWKTARIFLPLPERCGDDLQHCVLPHGDRQTACRYEDQKDLRCRRYGSRKCREVLDGQSPYQGQFHSSVIRLIFPRWRGSIPVRISPHSAGFSAESTVHNPCLPEPRGQDSFLSGLMPDSCLRSKSFPWKSHEAGFQSSSSLSTGRKPVNVWFLVKGLI